MKTIKLQIKEYRNNYLGILKGYFKIKNKIPKNTQL